MEEQPGPPAPAPPPPQQQQQQQPPPPQQPQPQQQQPQPPHHHHHHHPAHHPPHHHHHHHHHHHQSFYYYNHNHHQYSADGSPGKAPPQKPPLQALKHEPPKPPAAAAAPPGGLPQQQEAAPRKKTGHSELNGNVGEREVSVKSLNSVESASLVSRVPNGSQQPGETNLTLRQTVKGGTFGKAGLKSKNFIPKGGMDRRNEKCYENKMRENQPSEKPEVVSVPNGVVTSSCSYITNGYVSKGLDNDGSGSESGYTTPKKRKGRRNSAKGCENLNLVQEKTLHEPVVTTSALKQDSEGFKPDCVETKGSRVDGMKLPWKCEAGSMGAGRGKPSVGDVQRKNSDAKVGVPSKKFEERPKGKPVSAAASKEDSWTLFKPPPVFPVDNSSAKIVPKISYASKVKENLNKAAQAPSLSSSSSSSSSSSLCSSSAAEVQPSSRLSQVPMSAMKSVTSASFSNGPLLAGADRSACSAVSQSLLVPAASAILLASSELVPQDAGMTSAGEQKKSSLFIYPSNMQAVLLNATPAEPSFQANQQSLGDIFQNQWGLSFINEPNAGPETTARKLADGKSEEVTFQGECPAALASQVAGAAPAEPDPPAFPKAYELDKRTSPQLLGTAGEEGGFLLESHQASGAFIFLSKDYHVEHQLASPTNGLLASTKEQRYQRGLERKESWGDFDLRAAVLYHTQEMESLCNLQKQDPKRIITYGEAMDHPDQ